MSSRGPRLRAAWGIRSGLPRDGATVDGRDAAARLAGRSEPNERLLAYCLSSNTNGGEIDETLVSSRRRVLGVPVTKLAAPLAKKQIVGTTPRTRGSGSFFAR
jgi:hypothetical protein